MSASSCSATCSISLGVILLCELFHVFRDLFATDILAEIIIVDISLHFHEVDDALEGIFSSRSAAGSVQRCTSIVSRIMLTTR